MDHSETKEPNREELKALVEKQRAWLATYQRTAQNAQKKYEATLEELGLIRRVSDVLRSSGGLKELSVKLVEVVISELTADFICLMLSEPETEGLAPQAVFKQDWQGPRPVEKLKRNEIIPLDDGRVGRALAEDRELVVGNPDELGGEPFPEVLPRSTRSMLSLPLAAGGEILGAMLLASPERDAFGPEDARTLTVICHHAAAALANIRFTDRLERANRRLLASESEARLARERLQRFFDSAGDAILISGPDGGVTYLNQAALDLGLKRKKVLGGPLAPLFGDQAKAELILGSRLRHTEEMSLVTPGGEKVVMCGTTPLPDTGEMMLIMRDVTQKKALERQLMHAEKLASVGILAAGVAHEIGNPLSAISGYAQLLDDDRAATGEGREFARAIGEEADRINKIIRDLLDYSRPSPHTGQAVEVNQAVESVLNMFFTQKRLKSSRLEIVRELKPDLPLVVMDKDQLQQLVLNMVMNAAQAMEQKGGRLTISTGRYKGLVQILFSDNGPGIDPKSLPLVFDPFFTTKPVGKGTGLGLAICHRIVNQAGGRIKVDSKPGRGTEFAVWLPAASG